MNIFGRSELSPEELSREDWIRKTITAEFAGALKALQKEHINKDEVIHSGDHANAVCSALEAVFLHGLKSSIGSKISSYLGGPTPDIKENELDFWNFLCKFTHKDVISQLTHLGQITTTVGMCRAWVRMALNDYLMESYLDAMLKDKATVKYFYKRTSYLRDEEQPEILKSYLLSLTSYSFQLSYNSSVLNIWTPTPLILCGLLESQPTPRAVVSRTVSVSSATDMACSPPPAPVIEIPTEDTSPIHVRSTKPRSRSGSGRHGVAPSKHHTETASVESSPLTVENLSNFSTPKVPPNTPYGTGALTGKDIEDMRKLAMAVNAVAGSESSGASPISCPDPDNVRGRAIDESHVLQQDQIEPELEPIEKYEARMKKREEDAAIEEFLKMERQKIEEKVLAGEAVDDKPVESKAEAESKEDASKTAKGTIGIGLPDILSERIKSEALDPVTTTAMATTIETIPVTIPSKLRESFSDTDSNREKESNQDDKGSSEDGKESEILPGSLGNNLGLGQMTGWSSQFDGDQDANDSQLNDSTESQTTKPKAQSFRSLLSQYTPDASTISSAKMSDILEQHPILDDNTPEESSPRTQALVQVIGHICNEKGLDQQNYQCKGCSRPIGIIYGRARVCSYDGAYYCYECHENDEYVIPSRIVQNWDLRKHKVCKFTKDFLHEIEEQPLINIQQCNPKLYEHVNELNDIKLLRTQLSSLKSYLFTCKQSIADDLRKRVWPKEYLYNDIHMYSLADLLQVQNGGLAQSLKKIIKYASKHVYDCTLCSQKGFLCEICDSPKVIFPFEVEITIQCKECKAVFHKDCKLDSKNCPKCERRKQRQMKSGGQSITTPDTMDYGYLPQFITQ
ncbi:unnamed protein product [Owenia fusiformis]|uniref:Uncharacterized protein n=1 Tax=Owenia fusiformis TaxID=6347 RepID=A0A8J1UXI2_OWEFU|nr:unnamed protein product [Owenia fusiformis]